MTQKLNKRAVWINERAAALVAKGWKAETATKRAAKEWRLQSPQHIAAERRSRDMARERYTGHVDGALMDAAQVAIVGHME